MDLAMIKTQLADFGTFAAAAVDIAKNFVGAWTNLGMLLDGDTYKNFFEMSTGAFEGLTSSNAASAK